MLCPLLLVTLGASQAPPIAKTPRDVLNAAAGGFISLGGIGFGVTAVSEAIARSGTAGMARTRMPYFVWLAALKSGQRLGRVSGGLSGGRALGQLIRGADDGVASMVAACVAGVASAPNLAAIPSSVVTFACFTYFLDSFKGSSDASSDAPPPKSKLSPGQRLDKLLGTTPVSDGSLPPAPA